MSRAPSLPSYTRPWQRGGGSVAFVLAGGKGSRLGPLTCDRAKPAVPFAGYRLIDFVLSNLVNSGYRRVFVLTQYLGSSLIRHLDRVWRPGRGELIEAVPAQMRHGESWFRGTSDAVYQNLHLLEDSSPEHVAVLGSDHVYLFAVDAMEEEHRARDADLSVAAIPVPRAEAHRFGVIEVDAYGRVTGFQEKPRHPTPIPGRPEWCLASMGNYLFRRDVLEAALREEAALPEARHDFGGSVVPRLVADGARVFVHDFGAQRVPGDRSPEPYWRDVGTIDSYLEAHLDLLGPEPALDLDNPRWPLRTDHEAGPVARVVRARGGRTPEVWDSLLGEGSWVESARVARSFLGGATRVQDGACVEEAVLLPGCEVGAGATLRRVVCDSGCSFAPGAEVGLDPVADRERFPFFSQGGVIVLPRGTHVPSSGPIRLAADAVERLSLDPATASALSAHAEAYEVLPHPGRPVAGHRPRWAPRSIASLS
ncbi:MAG: glucose-1-phosphate adenylyltransferase [Planctomycetota bacterium]